MMVGWVTNMGSNPEKNFIEILCIQMINQLCAGQNQKEFLNLDIWMLSYEASYSSKIQKMMSLYYIVENFFVLKKYNPIHQPKIWAQHNFEYKTFRIQKFWSPRIFGAKQFLVNKIWVTNIRSKEWLVKKCGLRNFDYKTFG